MLSIGDLVLDITIVPERRLRPDDDTPAAISIGGGGQSANFGAWTAWLGEDACLVTRVGDDDAGRRAVAELEAMGVRVHAVTAAEPTGAVAVLVGPDGERTMATQRGASLGLRAEDLRPEWFEGAGLVHIPAYSLFHEPLSGAAASAVAHARRQGALLAVDLSSVAGLLEYGPSRMVGELGRMRPDLLFGTAAEAETLGGIDTLARICVIKLGAAGCQIGSRRITAPTVDVVDPTGAGDAFAAGFCASFLHGASPVAAAEAAVQVAADAVSRRGARPAATRRP
jgi:sugar/nucleoside kinase (ribokinase family)